MIGETNEGEELLARLDAVEKTTGTKVATVTAAAGYAYGKVYGGLERSGIGAVIPPRQGQAAIRSKVPLRRFRYDARNDLVKCPRGKTLLPNRAKVKHGRFFASKAKVCRRCDLAALCLSPAR